MALIYLGASSLFILSCKSNINKQVQNEKIINKFAIPSEERKQLFYVKYW